MRDMFLNQDARGEAVRLTHIQMQRRIVVWQTHGWCWCESSFQVSDSRCHAFSPLRGFRGRVQSPLQCNHGSNACSNSSCPRRSTSSLMWRRHCWQQFNCLVRGGGDHFPPSCWLSADITSVMLCVVFQLCTLEGEQSLFSRLLQSGKPSDHQHSGATY